jgi:glycosyltransferase involved in cell wall biosynthesis
LRVLLMTEQIDVGGKRSHVEILRDGLAAIGCDVELIDWASLSWTERAFAAGGHHILNRVSAGFGHRWLIPVATFFLRRRVRRLVRGPHPPDVIHVQEPMTYFPARAEAGTVPVVTTIHGPISRELSMVSGLPAEHPNVLYMRWMETEAYRGSDLVISVDRPHAEYVRAFGRTGPIPVIENFVDTRRFHPRLAPAPFPADVEAWTRGRKVVLVPRRLVPKNGVHVAVRAARVLKDRGTNVAIVVAGEGMQRAELLALQKELGVEDTLRFLGEAPQERIAGWYRRADIVIVPSVPSHGVEEATSIAALEGQACGRPVIATAIGGLPEIIRHEVDGLLIPADDPRALAGSIERLVADPELSARLGATAAARVECERSHVHGAERYRAQYEALLGRGPGG